MNSKTLLAMEVPTAYLDKLNPLIDWHFAIATEMLKDSAYFDWYVNRPAETLVMLDNGMFEEGKALAPRELLKIALEVKPQVVFASDQVGDFQTTLDMAQEFTALAREAKLQSVLGYIPQGETPEKVAQCFWKMFSLFEAKFVGLSFLNERDAVIDEMFKQSPNPEQVPNIWYHFLGMYTINERSTHNWQLAPTSIDTVKPFKAAYHGLNVEDAPRGLGKWNSQMLMPDANDALLYRNIAYAHKALGV